MCEQAEEIHKEWKPKNYDLCINKEKQKIYGDGYAVLYFFNDAEGSTDYDYNKKEKYFWLPTLEQLFDMVGDYKAQISRVFLSIMVMKKYKFESTQELVINAVMEIKYKKYWNDEKWVKAND